MADLTELQYVSWGAALPEASAWSTIFAFGLAPTNVRLTGEHVAYSLAFDFKFKSVFAVRLQFE